MSKKKTIILLSVLAVILVACVLVYFLVIVPLLDEDDVDEEIPEIEDGEGLYLKTRITMYPEIKQDDVYSIEIKNKSSTYTFENKDGKGMKLKGYESLPYDKLSYVYLLAYVRLTLTYENQVLRDLSDEQMAEYGLTDDTCQAKYKVTYYDSARKLQSHVVRIGHQTFSDSETYYAAVDGRNSAYRMQDQADTLFLSLEEFVSPTVFTGFGSKNEAIAAVRRFKIGHKSGNKIDDILELGQRDGGNELDGYYFDLKFDVSTANGTKRAVVTTADSTYLETVFYTLYGTFQGESVIRINPTSEDLKQYGLDAESSHYLISAEFIGKEDGKADSTYQISDEKDGYYYAVSTAYEGHTLLIKIPKATLNFLTTGQEGIFEWSASDSIMSCFYEYLERDDEKGEPGMKKIYIRRQSVNAKGEIVYNDYETFTVEPDGDGGVVVKGERTGNVYKTIDESTGENLFSSYYSLLLCYPAPNEFNTLSNEQINKIKSDGKNLMFELVTENNNGDLLRYTYYYVNGTMKAFMETCEGKTVNGQAQWGDTDVTYMVSTYHLSILQDYFKKLLDNEYFNTNDLIY